ncbi:MAG: PilZ domain-containing protein [Kofleriaceae bacterium]
MDQRAAVRISVRLEARLARAPGEGADGAADDLVGEVEDLSRHGVFLRTAAALPVGSMTTLHLELPEQHVTLRAQVVRAERGRRAGIALRFVGPVDRRAVANFVMRCHAGAAQVVIGDAGDD